MGPLKFLLPLNITLNKEQIEAAVFRLSIKTLQQNQNLDRANLIAQVNKFFGKLIDEITLIKKVEEAFQEFKREKTLIEPSPAESKVSSISAISQLSLTLPKDETLESKTQFTLISKILFIFL